MNDYSHSSYHLQRTNMYYHLQHNPKINSQDSPAFFRRSSLSNGRRSGVHHSTMWQCGELLGLLHRHHRGPGLPRLVATGCKGGPVVPGWFLVVEIWNSMTFLCETDEYPKCYRDVIGRFVWLVLKLVSSSDPHPDPLFWHSFWHTIWKSFFLAYVLTFFLAFYLAYILTFFLEFYLVYLRRFLWLRSGGEHFDLELVVEVRQGTLWSGACGRGPGSQALRGSTMPEACARLTRVERLCRDDLRSQ